MPLNFDDRLRTKIEKDRMKQWSKNPLLNPVGQSIIFRKVVERQQANEYTRIRKDRSALCFMCYNDSPAMAQNVHICDRCFNKKAKETILAYVKKDFYGWCYNCASYQFDIHYVNVRCCAKCLARIAMRTKEWNEGGGMYKQDPFWKYLRRELGKDFMLLSDPTISARLKR